MHNGLYLWNHESGSKVEKMQVLCALYVNMQLVQGSFRKYILKMEHYLLHVLQIGYCKILHTFLFSFFLSHFIVVLNKTSQLFDPNMLLTFRGARLYIEDHSFCIIYSNVVCSHNNHSDS